MTTIIVTDPDALRQMLREELAALPPAPAEPDAVLSTRQAARLLGLDEATVRTEAATGRLPGLLIGRGWRFSRQALLALLRQPNPTAPAPQRVQQAKTA